jgi:exopolysaccharide biosynthesis polyprenyl glycosylphosphotransferase
MVRVRGDQEHGRGEMSVSEGLSEQRGSGEALGVAPAVLESGVMAESHALLRSRARAKAGERFWRDVRRRRMLAIADVGAAAVASLLVAGGGTGAMWALLLLPLWVVIAKVIGLYDLDQRSIRHLTVDELPMIAAWMATGVVIAGVLVPLTPGGSVTLSALLLAWVAGTVVAAVLRGTMRWLWRRVTPPELTAVLGDGELASKARRKVEIFPDVHLRLVATDDLSLDGLNDDRTAALRQLVRGLDRVIVAWDKVDPELLGQLGGICREQVVKLSVVSPLRGWAGAAPHLSNVADLPVLEYDTRDPSRSTMVLKRMFDVVVSSLLLLPLAPLFPLVMLAIRLDSRGPVIFTQWRAGRNGKPFRMYKLRTMTADAEEALTGLVSFDDLEDPMFKLHADPRVTRVGRLLRRFSLDELPQLVNVLGGQMSIVGPRPEQIELVTRYQPEHRFRLDVKPGVTGPMQIYGRGDLTFPERLAVELDYVENLSLARDIRILFQTLPVVLRGNGAY